MCHPVHGRERDPGPGTAMSDDDRRTIHDWGFAVTMSEIDGSKFRDAADWIREWRRPLLISHAKPDGDAIGSLVAMRSLLAKRGVAATAILFDPLPERYASLGRFAPLPVLVHSKDSASIFDSADGLIILDTCSLSQLEPIAEWIRHTRIPKLAVDHHGTRDDLADRYLIDVSAPANCSILFDWAKEMGWVVDAEAAEALFVGIATDTGWFRHSNTNARAMSASAELVNLGVRPNELFESIYMQDSLGRVRLLREALSTLELHASDCLAIMTLSRDSFTRAGAKPSDTEEIVNEPLRIGTAVVSVLLVEQDDGIIRVNLRSKPPVEGLSRVDVDVAAIARAFGGGGHRRAAGVRIAGELSVVAKTVCEAVMAELV